MASCGGQVRLLETGELFDDAFPRKRSGKKDEPGCIDGNRVKLDGKGRVRRKGQKSQSPGDAGTDNAHGRRELIACRQAAAANVRAAHWTLPALKPA